MAEKKSTASSRKKKDLAETKDIRLPIDTLALSESARAFYLSSGISSLYPPQSKAISAGLLDGKNMLISIPTASGKTLLAELAMLQSLEQGGKCLYIVPLRALASEKFRRFSEFDALGYKTGISTGDLDAADEYLGANDMIVATSEKVDSLIRNETRWLQHISLVILDEVHLLDSKDRGPTLEIVITKLRRLNPKMRIVSLSATVQNPQEVANWMDAACVVSDWRPTNLYEGVYFNGVYTARVGRTQDKIEKEIPLAGKERDASVSLAADIVSGGGQSLVFANSRKNAVAAAKKAGPVIQPLLTRDEQDTLAAMAAEMTEQSDTDAALVLASCIRMGVAFHHAGLSADQREMVETGFARGKIKMISATPTLAAGLNLPARRVIIASWRRYDSNEGMQPIPVMEYKQMAGRAGRPHLDPYGEAVLIAGNENDVDKLREMYIDAPPEPVESKLGAENALRTHVLSTVSNGFANNRDQLISFFKDTFFAHQRGMLSSIALKALVDKCLDFLIKADMCREETPREDAAAAAAQNASPSFLPANQLSSGEDAPAFPIVPTALGRLVSKMYLDPLSASIIIERIQKAESLGMALTDISFLHLICQTTDMKQLYLKNSDYEWVHDFALNNCDHFIEMPPISKPAEYEWFLGELKTAVLLLRWISEVSEKKISAEFDVGEGDIRQFSETAAWVSNAASRVLRLTGSKYAAAFSDLELRLQYGASVKLLPLLKIKGVGRVRARRLYDAGFTSAESFEPADYAAVSELIGPLTAEKLFGELGLREHIKAASAGRRGARRFGTAEKREPETSGQTPPTVPVQ
ncbi:MAG: ATP-dependent DNA helicase, partial [Oscillospiraceae bacterium]|nr:ATP-dependent DNA helicase [Oscillospiraceae bacterium]